MSLVEDNELYELNESDFVEVGAAMREWEHCPASTISHHGRDCCRAAREWVVAMDFSQLNAGSVLTGPRWIRQRYAWGPSSWPIHWCEAVRRKTLDCGALAALATEVFTARGVRSHPAQLIQQFSEDATRHWSKKWEAGDCSCRWIREDVIYHEGCAVEVAGGEIKVWDASAGWWVNPRQFGGYGGLLALRVFASDTPEPLRWGAHLVAPNRWQKIEKTDRARAATA